MLQRVLLILLIASGFAAASVAQTQLAELAGDGAVLFHSSQGEVLLNLNPDGLFIPASIVKIPLAQVALNTLGEDYRFETHFYRNQSNDLLIRGLGDPFLVSEEIAMIAAVLAQRGVSEIRRLVIDDSAFESNPDLPLELGASDPYAAPVGALAVNFNTVNLAWSANGELVSGESQTPLTALARELGEGLTSGDSQRINLGDSPIAGLTQAQQLFTAFLTASGISIVDESFHRAELNKDWQLVYAHRSSQALEDILRAMLRFSNNFIANQIFLTLGAFEHGYPATVQSARNVLHKHLAALYGEGFGVSPELLLMNEGSGLDRRQRISGAGMMQILKTFSPHVNLMPESGGVLRKSGTLTGIYHYVGYIPRSDGLYPFVILTSQPANNRDEILQILRRD